MMEVITVVSVPADNDPTAFVHSSGVTSWSGSCLLSAPCDNCIGYNSSSQLWSIQSGFLSVCPLNITVDARQGSYLAPKEKEFQKSKHFLPENRSKVFVTVWHSVRSHCPPGFLSGFNQAKRRHSLMNGQMEKKKVICIARFHYCEHNNSTIPLQ